MSNLNKIPVTVITGFLGAGKTTLVRALMRNPGGRRLAVVVNEFGDVWLGIGFAVQANFGSAWYVEGSLMPGLYHANENDLGHAVEIRSLLGVGYRLAGGSSIMLSVDHMSNADLSDLNPGTNMVSLRYRRPL